MIVKKSAASRLWLFAALAAGVLAACASDSIVVVGHQRAPISPAEVKIYLHPPAAFEEIAVLNTSSNSMFTTGGQKSVDKVIAGLKEQAAKLGANGVILEGFSDSQTGSVGSGVGSSSVSSNSAVGVGLGGSMGIYKKTGHGRAIFVPPESATP
jgi:ABC-type sugar transport system substrate-binding protein